MSAFPRELRWYTTAVLTAAFCAGLALFVHEGPPPAVPLLVFAALVVFTAQLPVRLSAGVDLSPGFMVCMAAIAALGHDRSLLAVTIACSLSHLRFELIERRSIGWLLFNVGVSALAYLAAAAIYLPLADWQTRSALLAILAIVPTAIVYSVVAWALLLGSYVVEGSRSWREVLAEILPMASHVMPFAILGALLGRLYLSLGWGVLVLIIVPIFIAREMFASYMRVKEAQEETVAMLIRALEAKDKYTSGHSERVATYARYIGEELNFMPARLERLRFAALMHDIGKLVVPNHLLNKPGRLTPEEFDRVRIHEKVSVQMLSEIDFLRPIAGSGHSDNTRFDPDDTDHPIEPYIVMIADAYDAMTSTRSYRKALPQAVAFQELRDKAGIQFHPDCVEALIRAIEKRGEKHGAGFEQQAEFVDAPDVGLGSAGLGDLLPSETSTNSA